MMQALGHREAQDVCAASLPTEGSVLGSRGARAPSGQVRGARAPMQLALLPWDIRNVPGCLSGGDGAPPPVDWCAPRGRWGASPGVPGGGPGLTGPVAPSSQGQAAPAPPARQCPHACVHACAPSCGHCPCIPGTGCRRGSPEAPLPSAGRLPIRVPEFCKMDLSAFQFFCKFSAADRGCEGKAVRSASGAPGGPAWTVPVLAGEARVPQAPAAA